MNVPSPHSLRSAVALAYSAASVLTILLYGFDKGAARVGWRRIPEKVLHLAGFLCGWPGGLIARLVFNHKRRKPVFTAVFFLSAFLNTVFLFLILRIV